MKTEVQIKAKVYDFEKIKKKISEIAEFIDKQNKVDYYFSRDSNLDRTELRLRKKGNEKTVTFKMPFSGDGVEKSREYKFNVDNASDFIDVLENLGIMVIAMKHKNSLFYKHRDIAIQLASIPELGYFIEIEKKCDKKEEDKARADILKLAEELGIKSEQMEKKAYLELLIEKSQKQDREDK